MELGLEDVALFRGCYMYMYVQASVELGPEDVSLLEGYPGVVYRLQWS